MDTRVCQSCGQEKSITAFKAIRGYRARKCKVCSRASKGVRYHGKTCSKHPELNGERLSSNSACVACHLIKRHALTTEAYHSNSEFKAKYLAKKAEAKAAKNVYREQTAAYRARKAQRTPKWSDRSEIRKIYKEAERTGMVVDHFFPLFGETVSGLHVPANLRVIPQAENDMKSNKHPEDFYGPGYLELLGGAKQ